MESSPPRRLSVVIPVYNSELSLEPLIDRLEPVLARCSESYEVILVNDGSRDRSWEIIEKVRAEHPHVRAIDLMRNYGQHNAILCGLLQARYEVTLTMDDDLQHPPEEIPVLLDALTEQVDVVYGAPQEETHGFFRDLASQVTKLALQSSMGVDVARSVSAFRAIRTDMREACREFRGPFVTIDVLLSWATTRFAAVRVRHDPRTLGDSNYTLGKLVRHALTMMTGYSVLPLKIASVFGFAFTVFGGLILVFVVTRYLLQGTPVPGFPFLASLIAILSGVQLFILGILGEYLARMHFRLMDKPSYVIRRVLEE